MKEPRKVDAAARHVAADLVALLDEDGTRAGASALYGRRDAGRAAADHGHVACVVREGHGAHRKRIRRREDGKRNLFHGGYYTKRSHGQERKWYNADGRRPKA